MNSTSRQFGGDGGGLDPQDWRSFRKQAHEALDDAIDFLEHSAAGPVWRPVPEEVKHKLNEPLPQEGQEFASVYRQFSENILPYSSGNTHPRFWGWVQGSGTPVGMIAELMSAAMNSNCGGRDHGALYVERQVIEWCKQMMGFPPEAGGLLVSGTSMANLIALTVARNESAGPDVRVAGLQGARKLTAYASSEVHESVVKALEILGLGREAIRRIAVDGDFRIDLKALEQQIAADRAAGFHPFAVIGSAGTVNTGAIDDLDGIRRIAQEERLWFHVDGAFAALGMLTDEIRPLLQGLDRADSIGFDFHKWMHVPYEAGCVLIRNGEQHRRAFTTRPTYLQGLDRGLAGGGAWPCDFGPELSRGFKALKVWFTLKAFGTNRLGRSIGENFRQARYLAGLICSNSELELLCQPQLNIVCFRFRHPEPAAADALNRDIVADLQETGIAAPSTCTLGGKLAIRVAITNHRSRDEDFQVLLSAVLERGRARCASAAV